MSGRLFSHVLAAVMSAGAALAHGWHGGFNIDVRPDGGARTCDDIDVDAGTRAVARDEQRLTAPLTNEPLIVRPAANSGIVVSGWDRDQYEILVCKAATGGRRADGGETEARARVAEIETRLDGRSVVTTGPSGDDWIAYLIVHAPRRAAMELETHNGPLDVHEASGRFAIRGENGPVALRGVSGDVTVDLENGPVSLEGGGGSMRIRTENGPISIHLAGSDWQGRGLDARAVNGPVELEIDDGYTGGVVVESSDHAPWSCGGFCSEGSRTWDDGGRRFSFGSTPPRVRLATENGPVAIGRR